MSKMNSVSLWYMLKLHKLEYLCTQGLTSCAYCESIFGAHLAGKECGDSQFRWAIENSFRFNIGDLLRKPSAWRQARKSEGHRQDPHSKQISLISTLIRYKMTVTPATCNLPTHHRRCCKNYTALHGPLHVSVTVMVQTHIGVENVTSVKTKGGGCFSDRCMLRVQALVCVGEQDCGPKS